MMVVEPENINKPCVSHIYNSSLIPMEKKITLKQGAGGQAMDELIKHHILTRFQNQGSATVPLTMLEDGAVVDDIVFSTDSHTVQPLIFPGGDLGSLSVCGTINDVAVMGAQPLALSAGFLLEEGLSVDIFETIVESMGTTAENANVPIITGDTKVVEKNALQQFMINTSGIGKKHRFLADNFKEVNRYHPCKQEWLLDSNLKPGDTILLSGNIAEHGIALLSFREGYGFKTKVKSDVAPVHDIIAKTLKVGGVVSAKDPTRGGLANMINEWAEKSGYGIVLDEERIPIPQGVQAACDMLGLNALEIGNEGKVVLGVVEEKANDVLKEMKKHPLGKNAAIIGTVSDKIKGVVMDTAVGGRRIVHKPLGDPVPRIC
jgi:hydrogenase expression/formation protein HypE